MPITKMKDEDYFTPKLILLCSECKKPITSKGVIRKGKAYHFDCWATYKDEKFYEDRLVLDKEYPDIATSDLDHLLDDYDGDIDRLRADLNANWCVIHYTDSSIEATTFKTKASVLEWIVANIYEALPEDHSWYVSCVLYKGKNRDFGYKVTL